MYNRQGGGRKEEREGGWEERKKEREGVTLKEREIYI